MAVVIRSPYAGFSVYKLTAHVDQVVGNRTKDGCRLCWIKPRAGNRHIFSRIGSRKYALDICSLFLHILFTLSRNFCGLLYTCQPGESFGREDKGKPPSFGDLWTLSRMSVLRSSYSGILWPLRFLHQMLYCIPVTHQ